ncbi:MAG TPA: LytR C-terminal domain-containing protein [Blastococcus sp.]|nr:LytR C-terminal domain-containing protein [Blastococcus sp.]
MSRPRLPLPPVPAATRAPVPAGAPRTSGAPFRAVPTPEPRADFTHEDDVYLSGPLPDISGYRSGPTPRVHRQTSSTGSSSPAYGDWTKPSRGDSALLADPAFDSGPFDMPGAPGTTVIPERRVAGRRRGAPDGYDDEFEPVEPRGPVSGPHSVVGGRAAMRAERQAADMARRKAEKRTGSAVAVLDEDEDVVRRPRRVVKGLVAMAVVALGVLGVYSYVSPETAETSATTPVATNTTPSLAAPADPLPELPTTPPEVEPIVVAPVFAPVTVLNATEINGLAAKVAGALNGAGWETPGVGGYTAGDVAASTVFFTEGDETQRQAAVSLVDAFPQLQGPAPRFFDLPADVSAPGIVVVLTGDWQP